jgi:hypothetical protein
MKIQKVKQTAKNRKSSEKFPLKGKSNLNGANGQSRTDDQLFTKQLLYH